MRKKLSRRSSGKKYRRGMGKHPRNNVRIMRGGYRI